MEVRHSAPEKSGEVSDTKLAEVLCVARMATSFKVSEIKCTELLNLEKKGAIDPFVIIEYLGKIIYFVNHHILLK